MKVSVKHFILKFLEQIDVMNNRFLGFLFFFFLGVSVFANEIVLDGLWKFKIDKEDKVFSDNIFSGKLNDSIYLPGSMAENLKGDIPGLKTKWTGSLYDSSFYFNPAMEKYRKEGNVKFPFFLTPARHYIGAAWYSKEVVIPENWKNSRIELYLERAHTETRIWVDKIELGMDSTMCVPHVFNLSSALSPGRHTITIRVDNRIKTANVGQDSHSLTDQTQGNWNGIVGKILLRSGSKAFIDDIQIYPDLHKKEAILKIKIGNQTGKPLKCILNYQAKGFNSEVYHETQAKTDPIVVPVGGGVFEMKLAMGDGMRKWDEFDPALYLLQTRLISGSKLLQSKNVQFGMREIKIQGKWFYINGRKTQLRGTVENCCFPLTGYAPMDVDSWKRIFKICKNFGLNHMRFHSYCPPEAAFIAADLIGVYLQPEGPSWPNHGSSLGDGKPIDKFLMDETIRLTREYGNYASFTMLASGNEPRGRWVNWVTKFVKYWAANDPRRVYTGASVGGSWAWQPANQYHVKAGARGLNWDILPESNSDFRDKLDTVSAPFVSHETGQWCAFPNFNEIKKYTGVNKAKNFELFCEDLSDHDMTELGQDFMMASGKLQVLAYKHEIEKTLRTPDYAGFQLLSLNDYSGQGTALVGILDVFWEEKGYCTSKDFNRFCGPVVPLIRTEKFVYQSDEHLKAKTELSYFGENSYQNIKPTWTLKNQFGEVMAKGKLEEKTVELGSNITMGDIDVDLSFVNKPMKLNLEIKINTCDGVNDWNFYVYPAQNPIPDPGQVIIAYEWTKDVEKILSEGGDVLLLAAGRIEYGKDVVQTLAPVFWNTSWFKMRPPHTTGILVNPRHPVFNDFITDYYADLQWWELMNKTQVMQFTDFPKGFQPLVQSIDTWFLNRKIGMLFEAKVGKGRLMVSSMNLDKNLQQRPVARQLYISILKYMKSSKFRPEFSVEPSVVHDLFRKETERVGAFTKDAPDELKPGLN